MKIINKGNGLFLLALLLISLFIRVVIGYMHIEYPSIPHDFYSYIGAARLLLEGKSLYGNVLENQLPSLYGPLTGAIFACWIAGFSEDYFLLKFPSIIFNLLTIFTIFYLIKELVNEKVARIGSIFYSFSYLSLLSSGGIGDNDNLFIFPIVLSLYLLIKNRYLLSGISLGIAIGFAGAPLLITPATMYYLYRRYSLNKSFLHLVSVIITFIIILALFYINSGIKVLFPYIEAPRYLEVGLLCPLNFIKLLIGVSLNIWHFLITHTVLPKEINPVSGIAHNHPLNIFFNQISTPVLGIGYIIGLIYIIKFKIENKELELIRNSLLLILAALTCSNHLTDLHFHWILPLILILTLVQHYSLLKDFSLQKFEIIGITVVVSSLLIYAILYRWRSDIPEIQRVMLILTPFLISFGTYLMLLRIKIRKSWAILMFGCACFEIICANPLLIFKPLLIKFIPETQIASGTYLSYATFYPFYLLTLGITLVGIILLILNIHRITIEKISI